MDTTSAALERSDRVIPGLTLGKLRLPRDVAFVIDRGEGSQIWDTAGRSYLDFVLGGGPVILGHAHPRIVSAVQEQVARGTQFFYLNEQASRLAAKIVELVPCAEAVKFCNDGTEATMYCLRIARAATGRELILKFAGGFHGTHDPVLQSLLSADPQVESAGIPASVAAGVLIAPFNNLEATAAIVEANADTLAAIIVEPVQRAIPPLPGFLEGLRTLCSRVGALLVFDEVVTGFRLGLGGAQEYFGVTPDLCALGKALGGGLPIAAVAGSRDLIELTVPTSERGARVAYMDNTLSGNPLSCAAALATLEVLQEQEVPDGLRDTGQVLQAGFREAAERLSVPLLMLGPPAMTEPVIGEGEVIDIGSYMAQNREASVAFGVELVRRGIFVMPGIKMYVSAVHTPSQIDMTVEIATDALRAVRDSGLIRG